MKLPRSLMPALARQLGLPSGLFGRLFLARSLNKANRGMVTPTVDALVTPDVDASLDEQTAKTAFWNAFKSLGDWWAALPPY